MGTTRAAAAPRPSGHPQRDTLVLCLALLVACAVWFLIESWELQPQIDDAYISYRYARNLVEGAGLVYNAAERVEGFTNLLWTLLVAAGLALGGEATQVAHGLGLFFGVACLALACGYALAELPRRRAWLAVLSPIVLLTSIAFSRWSISGLETTLFSAAVVAALWAQAARRIGWATAAVGVATLARPDGAVLAVAVFACELWRGRGAGWRVLRWPAIWGGGLALLTIWRLVYYGSLLPNTFYAKVPGVPWALGLGYLARFLTDGALLLLPPAAWGAWRAPRLRPGAAFAGLFSIYVVMVGGDAFEHGRFLLPVLAVLSVLAVCGVSAAFGESKPLGWGGGLCIAVAVWVQVYGLALPSAESKRDRALVSTRQVDAWYEYQGRRKADLLKARGAPVDLVGAAGIGSFGYHSEYRILDLLGLVDDVIARGASVSLDRGYQAPGHLRSNPDYVLARLPDYILIPRKGAVTPLNAHLDLWNHRDFEGLYEWDAELGGYRRRASRAAPTRVNRP